MPGDPRRYPLLTAEGVRKAFGGVQALDGVHLEIASSQVHALCGENGAGKSTLIKIICGAEAADAGRIWVGRRALPNGDLRAAEAAGISVIYQESAAFPDLKRGRERLCRTGAAKTGRPDTESGANAG
jgi:ABC-type sugar transport system ATPase subunit